MRVPLSWLREHVDVDLSPEELARAMTFAGLEVEEIVYVGCAQPGNRDKVEAKISGLEWDPGKIVVAELREVEGHPDADRLVLAKVDDGETVHTVVTGAPNLFAYKGRGPLSPPLKVAFAREGARLYDGHQAGQVVTRLKRAKIRGVESSSMVCSEKELGISDEHEGVIIFDDDAPRPGTPLAEYAGDVVFDVAITPNMSRNASILGVAREVAALTGKELRKPGLDVEAAGPPVAGKVRIEIREPEFNPRFTATLIEGVEIKPSPYRVQLRLRHAGMRPISNVVDVTNYVMLELGQPLHAFDYDVLVERARSSGGGVSGSDVPTLITRLPEPGERLKTLDDVDRELDGFTILVADTAGVLSLGGVMGGEESEVSESTTSVLLEAAAWDMINIRRSVQAQQLQTSEAGYRFSRGVHPEQALRGNLRAVEMMRTLAGGTVAEGVVDVYPRPPDAAVVELPLTEVSRYLGLEIPKGEVVRILTALEFAVEDLGDRLRVSSPDHRLDVGTGAVGIADLVEEIARIHGYEKIGETQITDTIPPQHGNPSLEAEEELRDLLARLGLQEAITYRITSPERERRVLAPGSAVEDPPYVELANPISVDRTVMRRSLLASVLEVTESNARFRDTLELFEIGKVYLPKDGEELPEEPPRLVIVVTGPREPESWRGTDTSSMDFYDLKGIVEEVIAGCRLVDVAYELGGHPSFHPGRTARVSAGGEEVGVLGELHPEVAASYGLTEHPVLAADFDLGALFRAMPERFEIRSVSRFPAVREDLAVIVDQAVTSAEVEAAIRQAGGERLADVRLFDLFRGEQVGAGKKSLAYRMAYQSDQGTLTDKDAGRIRGKILKRLESELGAVLR